MRTEVDKTTVAGIRAQLSVRADNILALTRALVECESPSGDVGGSRGVAILLCDAAKEIGFTKSIERIESPNFGEHVRMTFDGSRQSEDPPLLLLGHTDTVHSLGSLAERPYRVEGNRIFGPGIFDMKANCALALEAIRALAELNIMPRRQLVLLLTCDEEVGSETGRPLVEEEARRAKCVLVLEPPARGGAVKTGRKGTGMYTMDVYGIAAHAGLEPEQGASAIAEIALQISLLHSMTDIEKGININVGVVKGGTRSNVVAEHATAEIDLRFSSNDEGLRADEMIRNLQPHDSRIRLAVNGGINRPPLERNEGVLSLYSHAKSIAALMDYDLAEAQVGGASDGNFAAALGVPVLDGLGIDGDGAHAAHEHINKDDIASRGALIAGLIATL